MTRPRAKIGVIGGSGLYAIDGARPLEQIRPETPWGPPSDAIDLIEVAGEVVAFLPRHGKGHRLLPTEVPSRANLCALKMLGVEQVVAFSAVGSLKEELAPLDFVVPDQVIDRTRHRPDTYFGDGVVGHVTFADPFCPRLRETFLGAIRSAGLAGGQGQETLVCMEGPLFSSRAESELYRAWGAGLINMSALPEAKLAREAELCYALICMVTDYDCWHEDETDVDIQMVIQNLTRNAESARSLLGALVPEVAGSDRSCDCAEACRHAVITAPDQRPPETVARLSALLPERFPEV